MNSSQSGSSELALETNLAARKARHKRVFAGARSWTKMFAGFASFGAAKTVDADGEKVGRRVANGSPSTKLFKSYSLAVIAVFAIGAINPGNVYSQTAFNAPSLEGVEDYYGSDSLMVADQDGYMPKINPQTEVADRSSMNGKLVHEVESGDTLSTIAAQYGLKTNTLMWENGLTLTSTLKLGDKIIVPPVDGVSHVVQKNEDIKKIAAVFSVPAEAIVKQNQLDMSAGLVTGQEIFVPGAKPLPVDLGRDTIDRSQSPTRVSVASVLKKTNIGSNKLVAAAEIGSDADTTPSTGKMMIFPTRGVITQYFHPGHYAYDIANPERPPVWAAMDGVVVKASSGTWGGGYGNHVIIDHGNGLKTLYGHMEYLSVQVGDHVKQGQVIGKMGHTGNVRGRTGIHVHFEVIQNGVKKSPGGYF